ncbi:hypothetical protein MP228_004759 [Amoeboaphelidium protococcarum]|nr:hypothetical protein MP228_004759 [Amoeboaphelidium protococcarum]
MKSQLVLLLIAVILKSTQSQSLQRWPLQNGVQVSALNGHRQNVIQITGDSASSLQVALTTGGWPWTSFQFDNSSYLTFQYFNVIDHAWSQRPWGSQNNVDDLIALRQRHFHAAASSSDGSELIVYGGIRGNQALGDLLILDSASLTWQVSGNLSYYCSSSPLEDILSPDQITSDGCGDATEIQAVYGHSMDLLLDSDEMAIYAVVGGLGLNTTQADVHLLINDRIQGVRYWVRVLAEGAPTFRGFHSSAVDQGQGILYMFGGTQDLTSPVYDPYIYKYHLVENAWTKFDVSSIVGPPQDNGGIITESVVSIGGVFGHNMKYISSSQSLLIWNGMTTGGLNNNTFLYNVKNQQSMQIQSGQNNACTYASVIDLSTSEYFQYGGKNSIDNIVKDSAVSQLSGTYVRQLDLSIRTISVSISAQSDAIVVYTMQGWGFVSDSDMAKYFQSVVVSDRNVKSECIIQSTRWNQIKCISTFKMTGDFNVSVYLNDIKTMKSVSMNVYQGHGCFNPQNQFVQDQCVASEPGPGARDQQAIKSDKNKLIIYVSVPLGISLVTIAIIVVVYHRNRRNTAAALKEKIKSMEASCDSIVKSSKTLSAV